MDRLVDNKGVLIKFIDDFIKVVDGQKIRYALVSGIVAILHGRSRGTEDIDLIIERISRELFEKLHAGLEASGFECIQGKNPEALYEDYLLEDTSIRYVRIGEFIPEMELKLSKDPLDEQQLDERTRLPGTGTEYFFSTIETNIAFKEELLKSPKDLQDSEHLRMLYSKEVDEGKISQIKALIRKYRLKNT
ncbi:hypothetical protein HY993_03150 [Candidatus Micrarchaeota archaeon]|nr:hypothetical protein [Candidatus Micrarchaeota archaeon]